MGKVLFDHLPVISIVDTKSYFDPESSRMVLQITSAFLRPENTIIRATFKYRKRTEVKDMVYTNLDRHISGLYVIENIEPPISATVTLSIIDKASSQAKEGLP